MSPLSRRYADTRARSLALVQPLSEADCQAQSMADASPAKWHLAHTTWFFETFVLEAHETGFAPFHPAYRVLFNSYYQGVGAMHGRPQRGLLTRPSLAEVLRWREQVDARVQRLIGEPATDAVARLVELGVQHEQQHQELLLTDVLHLFSCNPLLPAYREDGAPAALAAAPPGWQRLAGGLVEIGHRAGTFAFDNESPRHRVWLEPYALADRLTTQGEWLEFMQAGGYGEPRWWLSAGWDWVRANALQAPLYWRRAGLRGDEWAVFGLHGLQPLAPHLPVQHVSLYEADAYARWRGARDGQPLRLPTEAEWENAAAEAQAGRAQLAQVFGSLWQWTSSAYAAYPGFQAWEGAVGEYNAKFMANQYVLRGSSHATPPGHSRPSYRNFFPADARWQFTGLRLARDEARQA